MPGSCGSQAVATRVSDPVHGNTIPAPGGHRTRHFSATLDEIRRFAKVRRLADLLPDRLVSSVGQRRGRASVMSKGWTSRIHQTWM
ncbi:3-deoxy-7-phosphoheptulonate synthase [Streptomyces sp. NPDC090119]|uniref:3-deoxy-7-phosphoheptulonate synthase n=1 Tax=Streptomyces sp. NPDC090119 TaxID=3365951 RepID=UPI003814FB09